MSASSRIATPLLKLAVLLVALVAVGAGTATAAKLITGKQVKNRSLTGVDVKKGSLGPNVLSAAAKSTLEGADGAPGKDGTNGADGAPGAPGPSDVFTHRRAEHLITDVTNRTVATQTLPAGLYQVTSALNIRTGDGGKAQKCSLRTGAQTDLASQTFSQGSGERVPLTLVGAVTIPAGAAGQDAQVRLLCFVDGDSAELFNISIVSTRTANAPVTTE